MAMEKIGSVRGRAPDGESSQPEERLGLTIAETLAHRLQQLVTELAPGFEPGRRLDVEGIAARFGVSVTPGKLIVAPPPMIASPAGQLA